MIDTIGRCAKLNLSQLFQWNGCSCDRIDIYFIKNGNGLFIVFARFRYRYIDNIIIFAVVHSEFADRQPCHRQTNRFINFSHRDTISARFFMVNHHFEFFGLCG